MKTAFVKFTAEIRKFANNAEKTGWTYIDIPKTIASKILPGNRKSFRVKGFLDELPIKRIALIPSGDGGFIMPINKELRKGTGKSNGDKFNVRITVDKSEVPLDNDLLESLSDDPVVHEIFLKLPMSHRNYFSKWIESAKTDVTKAKRIAMTLNALTRGLNFGEMLREAKKNKR